MLSVMLLAIFVDTTLYSKCDQASDLRQQLEVASELEFDLWDTVHCDQSNNNGSNNNGWVCSFKMLGLTFSSKLDWGSCIISIAKTASKKIGAFNLFYEVSFSWGCSVSL